MHPIALADQLILRGGICGGDERRCRYRQNPRDRPRSRFPRASASLPAIKSRMLCAAAEHMDSIMYPVLGMPTGTGVGS